jgi:hypothetical protein
MLNNQQITNGGIPQQSGLDIFSSIINYTGEFLGLGQPLMTSNIDEAEDYGTTDADPQLDAVTNNYPSTKNIWYKYHTTGTPYTNIQAPTISGSFAHFKGHKSGGDAYSFCGIYQQLSGLTVGKTYEIDITNPYQLIEGTLTVKTYRREGDNIFESSSHSFTMPYINGNMCTHFTATTQNDVILIDYTTESTSAVIQHIYAMRLSELQEYLVPIYAQDIFGNDHKVLRLNAGNTISED